MRSRLAAALDRLGPPRYLLALGLLIVAVVAAHAVWIRRDTEPFSSTDAYAYLKHLVRFVNELRPGGRPPSITGLGYASRPPLYQLATVPFLVVFGRSEDAALAVNLVVVAVLMAATYGLGKALRGPACGLLAALLVAAYPPVIHLAHTYRPNLAVAAAVAVTAVALARFAERPTVAAGAGVAALLGMGVLLHPSFVWMIAGATAVGGVLGTVRFVGERRRPPTAPETAPDTASGRRRPRALDVLAVAGAALVLALAAAWYLGPGRQLLDFLRKLSSPELAEFRGYAVVTTGFPWVEPTFGWYARTAPYALSLPLAVLAGAGGVWLLLRRRRLDALCGLGLVGAYVLLSLQTTRSWTYAAAALPFAAVAGAALVADLRPPALRRAGLALVAVLSAGVFAYVVWGAPPAVVRLAEPLGDRVPSRRGCLFARAFCPAPALGGSWHEAEILDYILADPACSAESRCTLLVVNWGSLTHEQFKFHLLRDPRRLALAVAHNSAAEWGFPYPFATLLGAEYLLSIELPVSDPPETDLAYGPATARFLSRQPPEFAAAHELVERYPMPDELTYTLYRRTRPVTREEVAATIAALEIAERHKPSTSRVIEALATRRP